MQFSDLDYKTLQKFNHGNKKLEQHKQILENNTYS